MINEMPAPAPEAPPADFIDPTNYALDENLVAKFRAEIFDLTPQIETQRIPEEARWNRYHHLYAGKNTAQSRFYVGINDAYIRQGFKAIWTQELQTHGNLFSQGSPNFAISSTNPEWAQAIPAFVSTIENDIRLARLESNMAEFLHSLFVYGCGVAKTGWLKKGLRTANGMVYTYNGPTFQPVNLRNWYIDPITSPIDEARVVWELFKRTFGELRSQEGEGAEFAYLGVDRVKEAGGPEKDRASRSEQNYNLRAEAWSINSYQVPDNRYTVRELYFVFDLHQDGEGLPCKATMCNDVCIELRQNPFPWQTPPYLKEVFIPEESHGYGIGAAELIEHLQYVLNAIINQGLDANLFQASQMVAIDASRYRGRLNKIEISPMAVFPFNGPVKDAIQFFAPPNVTTQIFQVADVLAASMKDTVGSPASLEGQVSRRETTATLAKLTSEGADAQISFVARKIARNVLGPWMPRCIALEQRCRTDEEVLTNTGAAPFRFDPRALVGLPQFQWLLSPEAEAYQQQQALQQQQQQQQYASHQMLASANANPTGDQSGGAPLGAQPGIGSGGGI